MTTSDVSAALRPATESSRLPGEPGPALLRPLRIRDFRLLFTGETVSVLGDQFHFVALTWLQARIPADRRGRVMSLVTLGSVGLAPISLALAGVLVDLGLVTQIFLAGGAIFVVASLAGIAWGVPKLMVWPSEETPAG